MALQNEKNSRYLLRDWKPENPAFWENKGKHIARRNLWISVSCLLLAFCVWMLFSAVTVNLNKIGFNFTTDWKSTRLNSSHVSISYAVFCLKKKKQKKKNNITC